MNDETNKNLNGEGELFESDVNNESFSKAETENTNLNTNEAENISESAEESSATENTGNTENTEAAEKPAGDVKEDKSEHTGGLLESLSAPTTPPVANSTSGSNKKTAALVICACVIGVIVTALGIIGIVKVLHTGSDEPETNAPISTDTSYNAYVPESNTQVSETEWASGDIYYITNPQTTDSTKKTQDSTKKNDSGDTTAVQQTIEGLPPLEKTGDNILSDSADNEFIKLVSEKYGVDPKNLVAIYAIPDKGNNFVLEFDGSTDSNGNIIKSPDTLKRVHQVDEDRNIVTATGSVTGNIGVSYAEGKFVFYIVTNLIMPQYPDYFTGVQPLD